MGWTFTRRGNQPIKDFLRDRIDGHDAHGDKRWRCVDIAIVNRTTAYIACEITEPDQRPHVVALVFLLAYRPKDEYDTGYKDMDETVAPYERNCPERILKLLTPLEDEGGYAAKWRADCWKNLAQRKRFKPGVAFTLESPCHFSDGRDRQIFEYVKRGKYRCVADGVVCKISKWQLDRATLI